MLGLGLSPAMALTIAEWSPAALFLAADQGFYAGGITPLAGRLYQDAAGLIPANLPGHPVGLWRAAAGSWGPSSQTTPNARPQLGRHPRTGRRNIAHGASGFSNQSFWPDSRLSNGLTSTKIGQGVEDGRPYIDIRWSGTANSTSHSGAYQASLSRLPAAVGDSFTAAITARLISGSLGAGQGIAVQVAAEAAPESWLDGRNSAAASASSDTRVHITHTITAASANQARIGMIFVTPSGATVDATFRLKDLQFERGLNPSPAQLSLGPLDVTEPGISDLWYLSFDGSDDHLIWGAMDWNKPAVTLCTAFAKTGGEGSQRQLLGFGSSTQGWQLQAPAELARYQARAAAGNAQSVQSTLASHNSPHAGCLSLQAAADPAILQLRMNGTSTASTTASQGSLSSYGNAALTLGAASAGFSGRLYDLFLINRLLTASELALTERYVLQRYPSGQV